MSRHVFALAELPGVVLRVRVPNRRTRRSCGGLDAASEVHARDEGNLNGGRPSGLGVTRGLLHKKTVTYMANSSERQVRFSSRRAPREVA